MLEFTTWFTLHVFGETAYDLEDSQTATRVLYRSLGINGQLLSDHRYRRDMLWKTWETLLDYANDFLDKCEELASNR